MKGITRRQSSLLVRDSCYRSAAHRIVTLAKIDFTINGELWLEHICFVLLHLDSVVNTRQETFCALVGCIILDVASVKLQGGTD